MAEDYFQAIRSIQPHGPYYLIGYCLGALVMFELAQQLVREGEKTALVLIDPVGAVFPSDCTGWFRPPAPAPFQRQARAPLSRIF
jgi:thioesterase domain-containing protein